MARLSVQDHIYKIQYSIDTFEYWQDYWCRIKRFELYGVQALLPYL